jgi:hypothetical protein
MAKSKAHKNSIQYKDGVELIISGIPETQKQTKLVPKVRNFETLNMSLDLFSN